MKDTKTDFIGIRVPPELKKRIEDAARKENRNVSNYLTNLILQAMKE